MKAYLDILEYTLSKGVRQSNRTGIDTFAVANQHFSHDMREGFPLLTTKKMAFKSIRVELEGFIKGITDKKWYEDRGCGFWSAWANPFKVNDMVEDIEHRQTMCLEGCLGEDEQYVQDHIEGPLSTDELRKMAQVEEKDLGPLGYSHGWRRFGRSYAGPNNRAFPPASLSEGDQLAHIVNTLKTNPNDRRMVCSAWDVKNLSQMALFPCHTIWFLTHINGVLNLHWSQRSCDLPLGGPCNIASYALLLELLAKEAGMQAGNLNGMLCNCHIYENQLDGVKEQLSRTPQAFPTLTLPNFTSIFDWTHQDVELSGYNPQSKIDFGKVAV